MTSAGLIRAVLQVNKPGDEFIDQCSTSNPNAWRSMNLRFCFGAFDGENEVMDISEVVSVTVEIHSSANRVSPALVTKTTSELDSTLDLTTWQDWTKEHGYVDFSAADMNLDLDAQKKKTFWIVVHALMNDESRRVLGGSTLTLHEAGVNVAVSSPAQGANLIPPGAVYDVGGEYEISVTQDRKHQVTFGDNDTSLDNDPEVLTGAAVFTTNGTTLTFTGTPGAAVTAVLRYPLYATLDETAAYVDGKMRAPRTEIKIIARDTSQLWTLFIEGGILYHQPVDLT